MRSLHCRKLALSVKIRIAVNAPRIAIARINHESNAWNPVPTRLVDFERAHLVEGEALGRSLRGLGVEVPGMLRWGELRGAANAIRSLGAEPVPLLSAWAIPSGPDVKNFVCANRATTGRVNQYATTMSSTVEMARNNAKPRTPPTVRKYRIPAPMSDVTSAERIVRHARWKP